MAEVDRAILRASVVKADVASPTLLFTFLGRVSSGSGRELERVFAVRLTEQAETEFYTEAEQWLSFADRERAIRTTNIWQQHFAAWGETARQRAQVVMKTEFLSVSEAFIQARRKELERERSQQTEWLNQRAREITGEVQGQAIQINLFEQDALAEQSVLSNWMSIDDLVEQLAAFHTNKTQPAQARSEADGVLRIYHQQMAMMESQLNLGKPEVVLFGVLMLVPESMV